MESAASFEPRMNNFTLPSASELRTVLPAPSASPHVKTSNPRPSFLQRWQSRAPRAVKEPISSTQSSNNEVRGGKAERASAAAIGDVQSSSAQTFTNENSPLASGLTGSLNALESSSAGRAASGFTFNATSPQTESTSSQSLSARVSAEVSAEYVSRAVETVQDASLRAGVVPGWGPRGGPLGAAAWERARGAARLASAPVRSAARLASFPVR